MKKVFLTLLIAASLTGCEKKTGCTDASAINFDASAHKNAGCMYSTVTFYGQYVAYNGIPIVKVDVTVDGNSLGLLSAVYPNGPGNCSAPGTLAYTFKSGKKIDWHSTVTLANGQMLVGSGSIGPSSLDCIKVNVTR